MRHHSQRVPGKNFRPLAGKPLFHYIIESLLACPEISQVVVDTDSTPVMEGLQQHFPAVCILPAPTIYEAMRSHERCLLHDTRRYRGLLPPNSLHQSLLHPSTISRAIQTFLEHLPAYDSLFSVTRLQRRLWDQRGRPINHNPAILLQTQDLPPVYEENSCIYIFSRQNLVKRHNRLGEYPFMFEMDAAEAWDIDEELDFQFTEFLVQSSTG
jgi:CMP-N-acetylneuraminic acid synthetase